MTAMEMVVNDLQRKTERIASLEAEVAALRKDAERLDWLESSRPNSLYKLGHSWYANDNLYENVRAALDAARSGERTE